jgi:hypothetical protein
MRIKPIGEVLHANNLEYPTLAVLQATEDIYTALSVQPDACVTERDDFIRNSDRGNAHHLFGNIEREARNPLVELFVTLEYSFPWENIEELLDAGIALAAGKLWILGCESLSLGELHGLKARFAQRAPVRRDDCSSSWSFPRERQGPPVCE